MIDNRTSNLSLPLPHADNLMKTEDLPRLIEALTTLDTAVAARATTSAMNSAISAAISALVAGAPGALDTLDEIAAALNDDASIAATLTTSIALKASIAALAAGSVPVLYSALTSVPSTFTPPIAAAGTLGGIKVGTGLTIDGAGVLSANGAAVANSWTDVYITPTAGQTVFTPSGGYTVDQIEVFKNGTLQYGGGDDYTATNGTTITFVATSTTTDTILVRKWAVLAVSGMVQKTGDTMTGNLAYTRVDKGTVGTGTVTFTVSADFVQRLQVSGALTVAFAGWPTSGIEGAVKIKMVNWGSAVVTLPTINWQLPAGGQTTTFATYMTAIGRAALQTSGTDYGVFWSDDAGTTIYGKLL